MMFRNVFGTAVAPPVNLSVPSRYTRIAPPGVRVTVHPCQAPSVRSGVVSNPLVPSSGKSQYRRPLVIPIWLKLWSTNSSSVQVLSQLAGSFTAPCHVMPFPAESAVLHALDRFCTPGQLVLMPDSVSQSPSIPNAVPDAAVAPVRPIVVVPPWAEPELLVAGNRTPGLAAGIVAGYGATFMS